MKQKLEQIYQDTEFQILIKKKNFFSWLLAFLVMGLYFSFILIVAFLPELFATVISDASVISVGIPIGVLVILSSFVLTGVYVYRANKEFDKSNQDLINKYK